MADARAGRSVDFKKLSAALSDDETPLASILALMAASESSFHHTYKTGVTPDASDTEWLTEYRAQLLESGLSEQAPNTKLNQSVEDLLPWASHLAENFVGNGISAFDLVQETVVGLSEGIAAKIPASHFEKELSLWCQYRALKAIANEPDWIVYPAAELALVDAWLRAKHELAHQGNHHPSDAEIAQKMGRPESDAVQAAKLVAAQAKTGQSFQINDND